MISVNNIFKIQNSGVFMVELLADGKPKKYRFAVEPIELNGKIVERIVCEDGLTQLLHARPFAAQSFFRMVGHLYRGKSIEFPVDLG
jgi:hypothetical protein